MKILLVGEYSRLHNSLKEGLVALGHEVTLIAAGDFFKNFPSDLKLKRRFDSGFSRKIKIGIHLLSGFDITSYDLKRQFFDHAGSLKNYDVVQLINEKPIGVALPYERAIVQFLKKHNKKLFLLCCGTDYLSITYAHDKKYRYSVLTPYFEDKISAKKFQHVLKPLQPNYLAHHQFIFNHIEGVVASDIDYHLPMLDHSKYIGLIPNPINLEKIEFIENRITDKVVIFHGINRQNFYKKGNDFFKKALEIIAEKFQHKVEIKVTENVPYQTYIDSYNTAHIFLDMVYAYDQGYNALEAMAKGKVVFTGAEREFLEYYNLAEDEVCINALPDVDYLVEKLSWLIENPSKIEEIGKNARKFIEEHHDYRKVAQQYFEVWGD